MNILLSKLVLENFKGRTYTAYFDGSASIRGTNASGKTTLFDAFCWALWGKDSQGRTDFAIKNLNERGETLHNMDHSVEVSLIVDGYEYQFKRVFREIWTKKRGSATATHTGHESTHFVNGIPYKLVEYRAKVESIISEETFKLLTSPAYFPSLDWKKRREILITLAGNVETSEILNSDKSLSALSEILKKRTADEHKQVISARRATINKQLAEIPSRIDELKKTVITTERSCEEIADDGNEIAYRISELEAELAPDAAAVALRQKINTYEYDKTEEYRKALATYNDAVREINSNYLKHEAVIKDQTWIINSHNAKITELRAEYMAVYGKEIEILTECPTCGQSIPEERLEASRTAENERKENRKNEISVLGKSTTEKLNIAKELLAKAEAAKVGCETARKKLSAPEEWDKGNDSEYQALLSDFAGIDKTKQESEELKALKARLEGVRREYAEAETGLKIKARIEELSATLKALQNEYEDLEQQLFLIERFIVKKVELLEAKIAGLFSIVRFKMFDVQINEGIKETCDILVGGVPYGAGLNRSAEINAGLDIINVLSKHYGITAPVWIDNAEAVVNLYPLQAQIIALYVDKEAQSLEIISTAKGDAA
jgi:DNA repair exonuclease SbcCD ATPase subunit